MLTQQHSLNEGYKSKKISISSVGKIGKIHAEKWNLTQNSRINSNGSDFNVRPETMKILEENIGSKISDIACSDFLLNISPLARETEEKKINK